MTARECPICGSHIEPSTGRGRPRVYCSDRHRGLAWYHRNREQRQPQPWTAADQEQAAAQLADWLATLPDPLTNGL